MKSFTLTGGSTSFSCYWGNNFELFRKIPLIEGEDLYIYNYQKSRYFFKLSQVNEKAWRLE